MLIEIVVTGNRSLYRSLYESVDRTTKHRTYTGAARAIIDVERDAKDWAKSMGRWGSYTLRIDGVEIERDEKMCLSADVDGALSERRWTDPVAAIAKAIERIHQG